VEEFDAEEKGWCEEKKRYMERQDTRAEEELALKRRKIEQGDKDRRFRMAQSLMKENSTLTLREAMREAVELKNAELL
jgi:hypothetical protein